MTLPPVDVASFVAYAAGAAAVVWLVSGRRRTAMVLSTVALIGALAAALLLMTDATVTVADHRLVQTPYVRLWLVTAAASLLALHLAGLASGERPGQGALALATLATLGIASTVDDPIAALLVLAAATLVAVSPGSAGAQLRATTAVVVLAFAATGLATAVGAPGSAVFDDGHAVAAALLLAGAAVAIRTGAVALPTPGASLAMVPAHSSSGAGRAWLPAATLLVLVPITAGLLRPTGGDLRSTAEAIRLFGIGALLVACLSALIARDIRSIVGATVVANAALVLFAISPDALADPDRGPRAVAVWLPLFALLSTWAVAWLIALGSGVGSLSLRETRGWARRRPVLVAALVVGGALSYGWPGSLPWEARAALLDIGIPPGQLREAAGVMAWLPALGLVRLLLVGVRRSSTDAAVDAQATADWPPIRRGSHRLRWSVRGAPIASALVLALAASAALLAPGAGDLPALAGSAPGVAHRSPASNASSDASAGVPVP